MVDKIKRADVANFIRSFKGGNFDQQMLRDGTGFFQKLQKAFVYNNTGAALEIGSPVYISGVMNELPYDDLVNEYLSSGFCLTGETYNAGYPDRPVAFCLEPIDVDGIGECRIPGLVAADVDGYDYDKPYAVINKKTGRIEASESEGPFSILGASEQGVNGHFSYMVSHSVSQHRCWFNNDGRWPLEPGEFVGVVGMMDSNLTSEEAHDKFVSDGLRLRVKRIGLIDDANAAWLGHGVALDPIAPGATGRGVTWDLFLAYVWRDPAVIGEGLRFLERADWRTTDWTDPQGVSRRIRRLSFVKYPGDYTCIDAAAPNDDQVLCLLNPSPCGPAVDRIVSVDVSAGTAEMACGVTATSPLASLTADDAGRKALLFRNSVSQGWQLLINHEDMFVKKTSGVESGGTEQNGD